jgi:hypothetical protein
LLADYVKLTDNVSLASIIHKLAELDGARWFVKGTTLNYLSKNNPAGVYQLNYVPPTPGSPMVSDCLHLFIHRNFPAGKEIQVTTQSWNQRQKKVLSSTATVPGVTSGTLKPKYHAPQLTGGRVQGHATNRANEMARHQFPIEATVVGDTSIDVAMALQLSGTGFFDQQYQIDEITHTFGMQGFTTQIRGTTAGQGREASAS